MHYFSCLGTMAIIWKYDGIYNVGTCASLDRLTSPPAQQVIGTGQRRGTKATLKIVDYGHDEVA